jgi:hypothetical protein
MNPNTNKFEELFEAQEMEELIDAYRKERKETLLPGQLVRPNGEPVPEHWSLFTVGEEIPIKGYVFRIAYIGETSILFEPIGSFKNIQKEKKKRKHA